MEILKYLAVTIDTGQSNIPKLEAEDVLTGTLNTVYWAGGAAAIIVIVIAGLLYVTSEGNSNNTKRAKDAILYSVVGLVFIMLAFVITNFVVGRF